MLPLPAHHRHCRTTPFVDWANGIIDVQRQETTHSYDILGARMLWKPKEAKNLTNFIDQLV